MKIIISDSIAINFFGFDWFVVFFVVCVVSSGSRGTEKGRRKRTEMKRKGRKAKLNFLILLETPPLDIAADHHRVPPLKFLLPGAH